MAPKRGIQPRDIALVAATIADREGLEAVTPLSVAERLRVRPSAIYAHVDGVEGLRYALATHVAWELAARLRDARDGRKGVAALEAIARAYRTYARKHPGAYRALLRPRRESAERHFVGGFNAVDQPIVHALRETGLRPRDAAVVAHNFRAALHGFVLFEADNRRGTPDELNLCFRRLLDSILAPARASA